MRSLVFGLFLLMLFSDASCQTSQSRFEEFALNFVEISLPIDVSKSIGEIHLNEGSKPIIQSDFLQFLLLGDNEVWGFGSEYSYKSFFKFNCGNHLVLVYQRAYYPENILDEKSEFVLNVYSEDELVASKVIQAYYGDDVSIFSKIKSNFEIVLTRESYELDKTTGESELSTISENHTIDCQTGLITSK